MRGRRYLVGVMAAVVVVALGIVIGWRVLADDAGAGSASGRVGPQGGTTWNGDETVGVRVAPGGVGESTVVRFQPPPADVPESGLAALVDVVVPAVDIVADHPIMKADVVFTLDPAVVPTEQTGPDGQPQRSIHNAGIEVFNETLGTWIPIPTTVEDGNRLVAQAPHFSLFRAVLNKVGEFVVDVGRKVTVVLTTALKPIDLLWRTGLSLVTTFVDSLLGRFDESKYNCEPRNAGFTVGVTDDTGQKKLAACVRKAGRAGAAGDQLLIRNGLAVPFRFSAPGVAGLTPNLATGELELVAFARGMTGMLNGEVYASGLDVAAFDLAGNAPQQFTVKGELSWVAALVDLAMGLLTVVLPVGKVAAVEYRAVLLKVREKLVVEVGQSAARLSYQRVTEILEVVAADGAGGASLVFYRNRSGYC